MRTSEEILKWLEENRDWFKESAICKKVGIDKGNFSRYKKDGIPEKYLQPIMKIIMPLGFTLDEVIADNNKPENKKEIEAKRQQSLATIKKDYLQPLPGSDVSELINRDIRELGLGIYKTEKDGSKTYIDPLSDKGEILQQIAAIKAEKIPEHRNTPMGRRVWVKEQQKRIAELESKLTV
jgi:hypothetical protein